MKREIIIDQIKEYWKSSFYLERHPIDYLGMGEIDPKHFESVRNMLPLISNKMFYVEDYTKIE